MVLASDPAYATASLLSEQEFSCQKAETRQEFSCQPCQSVVPVSSSFWRNMASKNSRRQAWICAWSTASLATSSTSQDVPGLPIWSNLSAQLSPERCQRVELSRQVAHAATFPMLVCRQSKSSFTPKSMQHANQATKQMGSGSNFALHKCRSVLTALLFTICSCSSLREGFSPPWSVWCELHQSRLCPSLLGWSFAHLCLLVLFEMQYIYRLKNYENGRWDWCRGVKPSKECHNGIQNLNAFSYRLHQAWTKSQSSSLSLKGEFLSQQRKSWGNALNVPFY
jgi:hypothetical protein